MKIAIAGTGYVGISNVIIDWQRAYRDGKNMRTFMLDQIQQYFSSILSRS